MVLSAGTGVLALLAENHDGARVAVRLRVDMLSEEPPKIDEEDDEGTAPTDGTVVTTAAPLVALTEVESPSTTEPVVDAIGDAANTTEALRRNLLSVFVTSAVTVDVDRCRLSKTEPESNEEDH